MAGRTGFGQLDQVTLKTTRRVSYLSAPPGVTVSPEGLWSVSVVMGDELLLTKQQTVIKIPAADVTLVSKYDISAIANMRILQRGQDQKNKA